MDTDDLSPPPLRAPPGPRDLTQMGVEELRVYIAELQAEARRAQAEMEKKERYKQGAEAFFKK